MSLDSAGLLTSIDWQGLKEIAIVCAATLFFYLGYRLYVHGVDLETPAEMSMTNRLLTITINGAGSGFVAMVAATVVLSMALMHGGARRGDEELGNPEARPAELSAAQRKVIDSKVLPAVSSAFQARESVRDSPGEPGGLGLESLDELWDDPELEEFLQVFGLETSDLEVLRDSSAGIDVRCKSMLGSLRPYGDGAALADVGEVRPQPLELNRDVDGSFEGSACHWYSLDIVAEGMYEIRTSHRELLGADTLIQLFDEEFQLVGDDDDGGGVDLTSVLRESLGGDGGASRYYLAVSAYGFRRGGSYGLSVSRVGAESEVLLPVPSDYSALSLETEGFGRLEGRTEVVWYEFVVNTRGRYALETRSPDDSQPGVDTVLRLYGSSGDGLVFLGEDDDGAGARYSRLVEDLEAGTYFVKVSGFRRAEGSFRIVVAALE